MRGKIGVRTYFVIAALVAVGFLLWFGGVLKFASERTPQNLLSGAKFSPAEVLTGIITELEYKQKWMIISSEGDGGTKEWKVLLGNALIMRNRGGAFSPATADDLEPNQKVKIEFAPTGVNEKESEIAAAAVIIQVKD